MRCSIFRYLCDSYFDYLFLLNTVRKFVGFLCFFSIVTSAQPNSSSFSDSLYMVGSREGSKGLLSL